VRRRTLLTGAAAGAVAAAAAPGEAAAQPAPGAATAVAWPGGRPVRVIHPSQPGGPGDIYTRLLCEHLSRALGGAFVTENRVGGTGTIGTAAAAAAPPDGHTLLLTSNTAHVVAPLVLRNPGFDPVRDFEPVAAIYRYGMMLIVNPRIPARGTVEFVAWAKARPNGVNMASVGTGSVGHLMAERFHLRAGFQRVHIPYHGGPAAVLAVAQGESDYIFDNIGNSGALIREGKLRGLALTGRGRSRVMPEIPTLAEEGFPGFTEEVWFGLYTPAGTPRAIVDRLNLETNRWIATPAVQQRMLEGAHEPMGGTPEDHAEYWRRERELWAEVVRETGVRAE
jgi:tripartite-type tricarboxylate transporter receptor subunit TctC